MAQVARNSGYSNSFGGESILDLFRYHKKSYYGHKMFIDINSFWN